MTQFKGFSGLSEAQLKQWFAFLVEQDSAGNATTGVLTGLAVTQTTTASANVNVGAGLGVVQDATLDGATPVLNDTNYALDVLTANPMGGLPRNDIVVYDTATVTGGTGGIRVIVGTPNASPTDPSVPASAVPLARLRHAASATTVPSAKIDDLRTKVSLFGAADESNNINGVPFAGASSSKAAKRMHWGVYSSVSFPASGNAVITHGAGFTPTVCVPTVLAGGLAVSLFALSSTTATVAARHASDGSAYTGTTSVHLFLGE